MFIPFEKWHGCKNDFVVIWMTKDDVVFNSLKNSAKKLCSRAGEGIGADGIIVLETASSRELIPETLHIINSDGSLAETCGNGIRCAALSVLKKLREEKTYTEIPEALAFSLPNRDVNCQFLATKDLKKEGGKLPLVSVDMGQIRVNDETDFYPAAKKELEKVAAATGYQWLKEQFATCEIGNRHIVIFADKVEKEAIYKVGPLLQKSDHWDGINVHIAVTKGVSDKDNALARQQLGQELNEVFEVMVWERGVGPTQACGSGACAVGAAALRDGFLDRDAWVGVDMPGGRLFVRQTEEDENVTLAGPGEFVFQGTLEI